MENFKLSKYQAKRRAFFDEEVFKNKGREITLFTVMSAVSNPLQEIRRLEEQSYRLLLRGDVEGAWQSAHQMVDSLSEEAENIRKQAAYARDVRISAIFMRCLSKNQLALSESLLQRLPPQRGDLIHSAAVNLFIRKKDFGSAKAHASLASGIARQSLRQRVFKANPEISSLKYSPEEFFIERVEAFIALGEIEKAKNLVLNQWDPQERVDAIKALIEYLLMQDAVVECLKLANSNLRCDYRNEALSLIFYRHIALQLPEEAEQIALCMIEDSHNIRSQCLKQVGQMYAEKEKGAEFSRVCDAIYGVEEYEQLPQAPPRPVLFVPTGSNHRQIATALETAKQISSLYRKDQFLYRLISVNLDSEESEKNSHLAMIALENCAAAIQDIFVRSFAWKDLVWHYIKQESFHEARSALGKITDPIIHSYAERYFREKNSKKRAASQLP
jgi:hypothetical protein